MCAITCFCTKLYHPRFCTNRLWFLWNLSHTENYIAIPVALNDDTTGETGEPTIPPPLKHGPGERRASRRESNWHSQILRFPQKLPTTIPVPTPARILSYPLPTPRKPWLLAQALVLFRGLRPILIHVGVSTVLFRFTSKISPFFASCGFTELWATQILYFLFYLCITEFLLQAIASKLFFRERY